MNLHEYQAKQLFSEYGIPVPQGIPVDTVEAGITAAQELGGDCWMVKAQIQAGGRGKSGGIRRAQGMDELGACLNGLLGTSLVTSQTGKEGLPVNTVLVEQATEISRELYFGTLVDRSRERVVFMVSSQGGMDIEQVAATRPDQIHSIEVDPTVGLQPFQCRKLAYALELEGSQVGELSRIMFATYRLFQDRDLSLVEINPLVVADDGTLLALDAKINIDDNALFRQPGLAGLRDLRQEDDKETLAREYDLNYIALEGNIACMVNGAGLAMATMDIIKLHGGEPANFLDVGGGTTAGRVAEAFKLILSDSNVRAILVNIFGGIVRCDLIAEGIISAVEEVGSDIPVIVRLEGTNVEKGRSLLENSSLAIITATDLADAAGKAVQAAA